MKWQGLWWVAIPVVFASPDVARSEAVTLVGGDGPGRTASVFAPGVVSTDAQEYGVAVTASWSELYFTRLIGEESVIMQSRRTGDTWTPATPASFSGRENDSHPWLGPDNKTLFFVSRRSCPGANQAMNVWVVDRSPDGWTAPRPLGSPATDQTVHAPSVSASGTIYASGLIRLQWSGDRYLAAEPVMPGIRGSHPAVAADESFLVFSARREGGLGGKDLHVAFRDPDGGWTSPRNLGPAVNSESGESSPTLSSDGRVLFFSRSGDVWWVSAAVIEEARE